eukprot:1104989-Amphidinium_carterae.1
MKPGLDLEDTGELGTGRCPHLRSSCAPHARASRESLMIARVSQLESQDSHRPEMNPSKSSLGIFVLLPDWEEVHVHDFAAFA